MIPYYYNNFKELAILAKTINLVILDFKVHFLL